MNYEEMKKEKARRFFKLCKLFDLDDLERAYEISKKNIEDMNKLSEKDGAPYRFSTQEIDNFYLILYKELMVNHMKRSIFNGAKFNEVDGKTTVSFDNVDKDCLDFYNTNNIYKMNFEMLIEIIKYEFKMFEMVNIERAESVKQVKTLMEKLVSSVVESYEKFAEYMISEAKKNFKSMPNNIIYKVDMSKVTSIDSLIKEIYNVIQSMFDKKAIMSEFTKKAYEYKDMLTNKDNVTEEDLQKKMLIDRTAMKYFALLFKEKDANEFIRIYNDGLLALGQIMEVSSLKVTEENEPEEQSEEEQKTHRK